MSINKQNKNVLRNTEKSDCRVNKEGVETFLLATGHILPLVRGSAEGEGVY
jgi:hypothetical protein